MYKKVLFILLVVLLSINFAAASDNITADNVTSDDIVHISSDFGDVQDAIDDIDENGVIEVDGTIECYYGPLNIQKSMTLQGSEKGATFDGCEYAEIILINNSDVTLKNLKFTNKWWNYNAIEAKNSNLTIINCSFDKMGFAVNLVGGSLSIDNCKFDNITYYAVYSDCKLTKVSNSIFTHGGEASIYTNSGEAQIQNNLFKKGDSIWFSINNFNSDKSKISGCIFDNCGSVSPASKGTLVNCTFTNVYVSVSNSKGFTIKDSKFNKNSYLFALNVLKNVNIMNNVFDGYCIEDSAYSFDNVKVIGNTIGENFAKVSVHDFKKAYVKNSQFSNNKISKDMFAIRPEKEYSITNNIFENNTCSQSLALDFYDKSSVQVTNNIFARNHDKKGNLAKIHIIRASDEDIDGNNFRYLTATNVENNFLGFNVLNNYDLESLSPVRYHKNSWINVEFKQISVNDGTYKYGLNFIDKNGKVFNLPDYSFKIQDKKSGKIIVDNVNVKSGKATFTYNKKLALNDIFILNGEGGIVNRPSPSISIERTGNYFDDTKILVTVKYNNNPVKNQQVYFNAVDKKIKISYEYFLKTNNQGVATLKNLDAASYDIKIKFSSEDYAYYSTSVKNVKIKVKNVVLKASKLTTTYKSGKTFNVKVFDSKNKPVKYADVAVRIGKGLKSFTYNIYTDSSGVASAPISSYSKLGTFKVAISCNGNVKGKSITSKVTIKKAGTLVDVDKSVKKSSKVKIAIKNKASKKPNSGIKVKVKVYTGKSYKVYNLKTNSKGIVSIDAKKLKVGKHKIVISSNDVRYRVSAKCNVKIIK